MKVSDRWMTDYENAYKAANGTSVRVVICGGGWYRIAFSELSTCRYRKSQIVEMAARLERRAEGREQV